MLRRTEVAEPGVRFVGNALQERGRQPGLSDPGFPGEDHCPAFASFCRAPLPDQQIEFRLAADESHRSARAQRVEAAFDRTGTGYRPSADRTRNTFQRVFTEVLQFEQVADEPVHTFGDDDCPGLRNGLQASRQVWSFAHNPAFLRLARSEEIAYHDEAGGNSDSYKQLHSVGTGVLGYRLDQSKPRMH